MSAPANSINACTSLRASSGAHENFAHEITPNLPPVHRHYRFIERTPSNRQKESNLSKRRKILAGQRCALLDNGWICCLRLRCIQAFDKELVQSRRSSYLGMSPFQRKTILKSMLQEDRTFKFEGVRVCQRFITQVLSFSNSVIAAVKRTAICSRITKRASDATWRASWLRQSRRSGFFEATGGVVRRQDAR